MERFEVIAANDPSFDDLTLGVVVENQFYFNANSQWNELGAGGHFATPEKLKEAAVFKVDLR